MLRCFALVRKASVFHGVALDFPAFEADFAGRRYVQCRFFERDREISGDMSRDSPYGFARQDKL